MNRDKEAFVYCWTNLTNGSKYIGYHKGNEDDGYICSSKSDRFWSDYNNPEMEFSRQIIAHGTAEECSRLEKKILLSVNIIGDEYYNNGITKVIFTDEVRDKISKALKGKKSWCKGIKRGSPSKETREKISKALMGKVLSKETREKISNSNKGRVFSEETRRKLSEKSKGRKIVHTKLKIITPEGKFVSVKELAKFYGLTDRQAGYKLLKNFNGWYRVN